MDRRGFIGSILALGAAPAIVRADSLMQIIPVDAAIIRQVEFEQIVMPVVHHDLCDLIFQLAPTERPFTRSFKIGC